MEIVGLREGTNESSIQKPACENTHNLYATLFVIGMKKQGKLDGRTDERNRILV